MLKHVSFAIAAAVLVSAVVLWTTTGVLQTAASSGRIKAVAPTYRVIQIPPNAYLPVKEREPVY
jgi:hypothetical protein